MPRKRLYLNVPFKDKEEAKSLGAIWDKNTKKYFVPYYLDLSLFSKWSENNLSLKTINKDEALIQFKGVLESFGLIIEGYPIMSGKIQRCKVYGDRGSEKSGAYCGYLDEYPAGFMQNFKTGIKQNWKFELKGKISTNKKTFNTTFTNSQKQRELELLALQEKTALRLEKEWREAKEASNSHLYLKTKGLDSAYDLKIDRFNNLLIPLKDIEGKLWSLQRIAENGNKIIGVLKTKEEKQQNIEYSARKKACFYTQIPLKNHDEFLLCEGFATAMTLQKLLNKPIIMAIDSGNLMSVVESLNQNYPFNPITIYADNDLKNFTNTGLNSAKAIKEKYKDIKVFYPKINEMEAKKGLSDFNDIFKIYGLETIKEKIIELI